MVRTKTNTELIVIVTPEFVNPIGAGSALPELKFPTPFLPPNSGIAMHTPDDKNPANTPPTPPATIPVERLIESMKPEAPLIIEGGTNFGSGSSAGISSAPNSPAPGVAPQ
jgi:pilus assembly protein CpaC